MILYFPPAKFCRLKTLLSRFFPLPGCRSRPRRWNFNHRYTNAIFCLCNFSVMWNERIVVYVLQANASKMHVNDGFKCLLMVPADKNNLNHSFRRINFSILRHGIWFLKTCILVLLPEATLVLGFKIVSPVRNLIVNISIITLCIFFC